MQTVLCHGLISICASSSWVVSNKCARAAVVSGARYGRMGRVCWGEWKAWGRRASPTKDSYCERVSLISRKRAAAVSAVRSRWGLASSS